MWERPGHPGQGRTGPLRAPARPRLPVDCPPPLGERAPHDDLLRLAERRHLQGADLPLRRIGPLEVAVQVEILHQALGASGVPLPPAIPTPSGSGVVCVPMQGLRGVDGTLLFAPSPGSTVLTDLPLGSGGGGPWLLSATPARVGVWRVIAYLVIRGMQSQAIMRHETRAASSCPRSTDVCACAELPGRARGPLLERRPA